MVTLELETPIGEEEVRGIRMGDILYVSGTVITARDGGHARALEYLKHGKKLPLEFRGMVVYHCGPLVKKEDENWEVVAAGPTTSMRMESLEAEFIEKFRPSVIIGKGGMGKRTAEEAVKCGVVYCEFTGGAAITAAKAIEKVKSVEWLDLGTPEALWVLKVKEFGPLVVTIDSVGNNLYEDRMREIEANRSRILDLKLEKVS